MRAESFIASEERDSVQALCRDSIYSARPGTVRATYSYHLSPRARMTRGDRGENLLDIRSTNLRNLVTSQSKHILRTVRMNESQ